MNRAQGMNHWDARNDRINELAAFIREIDGAHRMGTGELAERIVDFADSGLLASPADREAYDRGYRDACVAKWWIKP